MVTYATVFSNAGLLYLVLGVTRFSSSSYLILKLILDFLKKTLSTHKLAAFFPNQGGCSHRKGI